MWDKQDFLPLTYEKGGLVPRSFSQVPGERVILLEASRALCPSHPYGGSAELLKVPPRTSTPLNVPLDRAHTQNRSPLLSTAPKNSEAPSLQAVVHRLGEDSSCLIPVLVPDYWLLASLSLP